MSSPQPTLSEKRDEWLDILSGEDRHCIINQISQMTWDAASFQIVNEARRLAPDAEEGRVQINGLMHNLLDRCFFDSVMAAVRRLMDTYPIEGQRGVYSLTGLIDDMRKHRHLFTREAMFHTEGLEYDYEPIREKCNEYAEKKRAAGEVASFVPKELWWEDHKGRHEQIDRLAGVEATNRGHSDMIAEQVFLDLRAKVEAACKEVIEHATKFIAHSASPDSRASVKADETRITLGHIWAAHKSLCEVASFIALVLLRDSCPGFLPIPQYDQFKYMDRPLIESSQFEELHKLWQGLEDKYNNSQWTLDDYEQEFLDLET